MLSVEVADFSLPVAGLAAGQPVVEADIDGDGRIDVVERVDHGRRGLLQLWLNRGTSVTGETSRILFERGSALPRTATTVAVLDRTSVLAGRFDADDTIDLLLVTRLPDRFRVRLLKGDGEGGFRACGLSTSRTVLESDARFLSAQSDGTERRESVLAVSAGEIRSFKIGNGGKIAVERIVFRPYHPSIAGEQVTDINGDGREDLVFYSMDAKVAGTHIHLARGGGRFRYSGLAYGDRATTFNTVFADADGDGRKELFTTNGAQVVRRTIIDAPDGLVTFSMPTVVTTLPDPPLTGQVFLRTFALRDVTDVDGDGQLDLLTETIDTRMEWLDPNSSHVDLLLADAGSPGAYTSITVEHGSGFGIVPSQRWVLRDFDGDGVKDVYSDSLESVRRVINAGLNVPPTVSGLSISEPGPLSGRRTLVAAGVSDADRNIAQVRFYFDANRDGVFAQEDAYVGGVSSADARGRWTKRLGPDGNYGIGLARFFALAVDDLGFASSPAVATIEFP